MRNINAIQIDTIELTKKALELQNDCEPTSKNMDEMHNLYFRINTNYSMLTPSQIAEVKTIVGGL